MLKVEFRNLSGVPDVELAELRAILLSHKTLEDAIRWAQSQPDYRGREDFVTQDEFTHDGIFPLPDGNFAIYGLT